MHAIKDVTCGTTVDEVTKCFVTFAGQAIVQMARSVHNSMEYAIKFFVSVEDFDTEAVLYEHTSGSVSEGLAQFLPQVCLMHHPASHESVAVRYSDYDALRAATELYW